MQLYKNWTTPRRFFCNSTLKPSRRAVSVLLLIKVLFSTNFSKYILPFFSAWSLLLFYHKELEILALFLGNSLHKYLFYFIFFDNDVIFYWNKNPFNLLLNLYFSLLCIWTESQIYLGKFSALFEMKLTRRQHYLGTKKTFIFRFRYIVV